MTGPTSPIVSCAAPAVGAKRYADPSHNASLVLEPLEAAGGSEVGPPANQSHLPELGRAGGCDRLAGMSERTSYAPGSFCRIDLATSDVEAATAYYTGLLGWETETVVTEEVGSYTVARLGGREVAALHAQGDAEREQGVPPLWYSYISVRDADATAQRVGALGGQVLVEPFDVTDLGRMAVVLDPASAVFMLWQPRSHAGAELVNEPGAWCWNTLAVPDPEPVQAFYADLFDWSFVEATPASTVIMLGAERVAGIQIVPAEFGVPPNWSVAFAVEDIGGAHRRAVAAGGRTIIPAQDVGIGHYSVVADPQGAGFGLYSGLLDP